MAPPTTVPRSKGHLAVGGCGCLLSLFFLGMLPLVYLEGETSPTSLLCMGTIGPGIGLLSAWVGGLALTWAQVYGSRVELYGIRGKRVVPFETITHIEHGDFLRIHTTDQGIVRVGFASRTPQARLQRLIEDRADQARSARQDRRQQPLPISIGRRTSVILGNLFMGLTFGPGLVALGIGMTGYGLSEAMAGHYGEAVKMVLFAGMSALVGLLLTWIFLGHFVRRYTFTQTHYVRHHMLWSRKRPISELTDIALRSEIRVYRGIERTAWLIELTFADGKPERIELSENGYPMEYTAADDHRALEELTAALQHAYRLSDR